MKNEKLHPSILILTMLVALAATNASAWDTTKDGYPTHETISLRAAQYGGYPNAGYGYSAISLHSADPDYNDPSVLHQVKHTSIAWSHALWTEQNILAANLSYKWVCTKKIGKYCVWKCLQPDRDQRAIYIGRASHYLEDGGQPYHDFVVQSKRFGPSDWPAVHDAFENWAHINGNFAVVDQAPTWYSPCPYLTAGVVSIGVDPFYCFLLDMVDKSCNPSTKTLNPCKADAAMMQTFVNVCWSVIGSGLKGVYRYNTGTALTPETVDLYLDCVNDPVTGYASTKTAGNQTRLDLARIQTLLMPRLMTPSELAQHTNDVAWWNDGTNNVVLKHPSFDDPAETNSITVINAVDDGFGNPIEHPDYCVQFLAFDRIFPEPGTPVKVTAVVLNLGGATAPEVDVVLRIAGSTVATNTLPPLPSLTATSVVLDWTAANEGSNDITVIVDPDGTVDETGTVFNALDPENPTIATNKENNVMSHPFYVGVPPAQSASVVKRFDSTQGGTFRLPSGNVEMVLPTNYSTVTPYIGAAEQAPLGAPFEGGAFISRIYSTGPAGRTFDQNLTLRLKWQAQVSGGATLYRFHEGSSTNDLPQWVAVTNNVSFDYATNQVEFSTDQLGLFGVVVPSPSLSYEGLLHSPLGNAILSLQSSGLKVSNLGCDYWDGVIVTMPASATEWGAQWEPLDPDDTLPVGAYVQEQVIGTGGSVTNGLLGTTIMTKAGTSNYVGSADFSPLGASNVTVEVFSGTNLVVQLLVPESWAGGGIFTNLLKALKLPSDVHAKLRWWLMPPTIQWKWTYPTDTSFVITNGSPVVGDSVVVTPVVPSGLSAFSAVQILASQIPSITITRATVSPLLLRPAFSGGQLTLQWFGSGVLQESANLSTWIDRPSATSPYTTSITAAAQKFYRVRQ